MTDDQNMPCLVEITDGKSSEYCLNLAEKFSGKAGFRYAPQYDKEVSVGYIFEHERDFVVSLLRARAILSSDTGGDGAYERGVNDMREVPVNLLTDAQLRHIADSKDTGTCRARIREAIRALPSPATISSGSAK